MWLLMAILLLPSLAWSQVTCSPMGTSVYCGRPDNKTTTITPFKGSGKGVIIDSETGLETYAVMPSQRATSPGHLQPIQPLEPLPTLEPWQPPSSGFSNEPLMNPVAPMLFVE